MPRKTTDNSTIADIAGFIENCSRMSDSKGSTSVISEGMPRYLKLLVRGWIFTVSGIKYAALGKRDSSYNPCVLDAGYCEYSTHPSKS